MSHNKLLEIDEALYYYIKNSSEYGYQFDEYYPDEKEVVKKVTFDVVNFKYQGLTTSDMHAMTLYEKVEADKNNDYTHTVVSYIEFFGDKSKIIKSKLINRSFAPGSSYEVIDTYIFKYDTISSSVTSYDNFQNNPLICEFFFWFDNYWGIGTNDPWLYANPQPLVLKRAFIQANIFYFKGTGDKTASCMDFSGNRKYIYVGDGVYDKCIVTETPDYSNNQANIYESGYMELWAGGRLKTANMQGGSIYAKANSSIENLGVYSPACTMQSDNATVNILSIQNPGSLTLQDGFKGYFLSLLGSLSYSGTIQLDEKFIVNDKQLKQVNKSYRLGDSRPMVWLQPTNVENDAPYMLNGKLSGIQGDYELRVLSNDDATRGTYKLVKSNDNHHELLFSLNPNIINGDDLFGNLQYDSNSHEYVFTKGIARTENVAFMANVNAKGVAIDTALTLDTKNAYRFEETEGKGDLVLTVNCLESIQALNEREYKSNFVINIDPDLAFKEGTYLVVDDIANYMYDNKIVMNPKFYFDNVAFTVNGEALKEDYAGQYTFVWDYQRQKYTGVNYKGYNYILTKEDNKLTLNVKENKQTLIVYLSIGDKGKHDWNMDMKSARDAIIANDNLKILSDEVNIVVYYDLDYTHKDYKESDYGTDAVYHVVGSSAPLEQKASFTLNDKSDMNMVISSSTKNHTATGEYALITFAHGCGLGFDDILTSELADIIAKQTQAEGNNTEESKESNFSTILCLPVTCLMGNYETLWLLSKNTNVSIMGASEHPLRSTPDLIRYGYSTFMNYFFNGKKSLEPFSKLAEYVYNSTICRLVGYYDKVKYYNYTKALFDLDDTKLTKLEESLNKLADLLLSNVNTIPLSCAVEAAMLCAKTIEDKNIYVTSDLVDFLVRLKQNLRNFEIAQSASGNISQIQQIVNSISAAIDKVQSNVKSVITSLEVNEKASDCHGLSAFIPIDVKYVDDMNKKGYPFLNFEKKTVSSQWGELIWEIYNETVKINKNLQKKSKSNSTALTGKVSSQKATITDESGKTYNASDMGEFSSSLLENEVVCSDLDARAYLFSVDSKSASQNACISVSSDDGSELTLTLLKQNDGTRSGDSPVRYETVKQLSGSQIELSLDDLENGNYAYAIQADETACFEVSQQSSVSAPDFLEDTDGNNELDNVVLIPLDCYKGLKTSASDPDYYSTYTAFGERGEVLIWGSQLTKDALTVQMIDAETGATTDFIWDDASQCFAGVFDGSAVFKVVGNDAPEVFYNISLSSLVFDTTSQKNTVSWDATEEGVYQFLVSQNSFKTYYAQEIDTPYISLFNLPNGEYRYKVVDVASKTVLAEDSLSIADNDSSEFIKASDDDDTDFLFAKVSDVWGNQFRAQNNVLPTEAKVALEGKNRIVDVFEGGSYDASVLLLTDTANGDALFLDDMFSDFSFFVGERARIDRIDTIYAGAGNDIIDLTSSQFLNNAGSITVHGGLGNDIIWANSGSNTLFGDTGHDRIVGAAGNDIIVGGSGNDYLHGGGGQDIFVFGGNWGKDSVRQLADGKVTLWFAEGSRDNWDSSTGTYTDGENSVTLRGVKKVTLRFGDNGSELYDNLVAAGAFTEFTSKKIFSSTGMLA